MTPGCEKALEQERARNAELVEQSGHLIAAANWWRDWTLRIGGGQGGFPESPYPPDSYGVPMPPPGVAFGVGRGGGQEPGGS